jgi:hypothetical protein
MKHNQNPAEKPVFIANFGYNNFNWKNCLVKNAICGMMRFGCHDYFMNDDSDGFVEHCVTSEKTAYGTVPSQATARGWYNRNKELEASSSEYWIHREDDKIWWTITLDKEAFFEQSTDHLDTPTWIVYKPCLPWSSRNKNGEPLRHEGLHPKIKDAVVSRAMSHKASLENAAYFRALIHGDDLSPWHSLPAWKEKEKHVNRKPVKVYDSLEKTAYRIANTVFNTVQNSFGQTIERTVKNKACTFETQDLLMRFISELYQSQEGRCAITDIPMELDDSFTDKELKVSLDRIDSNAHYEPNNLQLLCNFVNRWKSDDDNENFKRLIEKVQQGID